MTSSSLFDILGVVIGIVFIYLLLSIITSWIQEFIASLTGLRSRDLANIFQNMLDPKATKLEGVKKLDQKWGEADMSTADKLANNAVKALYDHPLFQSLSKPGKRPSYVSSRDFSIALFDLLSKAGTNDPTQVDITLENIAAGIRNVENPLLRERLQSLLDSAGMVEDKVEVKLADFRKNVYQWFDASMERGSGWYKRKAQYLAFAIGIGVALLFNADTIAISQSLWGDAALRESLSMEAEKFIADGESTKVRDAQKKLGELDLPFGWSFKVADQDPQTPENPRDFPITSRGWVLKILGLIITGVAISQGSSMWFDVLGKLINIRGTGGKPETESEGETIEIPKVQLEIASSSGEPSTN
jgi:hypothetical protein